jgi:energy-coupling factor transporter ATP-binding protein EcfA2
VDGVRYNDRVLVLGSTGSGKSEVLNYLLARLRNQRLVLDTKDEFAIPGAEPVRNVHSIDWEAERTIHFQTAPDADPSCTSKSRPKVWCGRCFDCVFASSYYQRNLTVCVHELGDVCEFNAGRTPRWFNAYISKGRARGDGLYMGSQRPMSVPTRALGESEHVFMVGDRFLVPQDHQKVAEAMGQNPNRLAALIDKTQAELGGEPDENGRTHAFLWFNRRRRTVTACPPLPPEHRAAIDVGRTLEVDAPSTARSTSP